MTKKYELDFCFKGNRNYVQGPDIFDAVLEKLKNNFDLNKFHKIKYAAHSILDSNADVYITKDFKKDDFQIINSVITFTFEDQKYHAIVSKNENQISCKVDYSEEIVRTQSKIDNKRITFKNILDKSLTETVVSMNKFYLQKTVTEDGKWIVVQFEYNDLTHYFNIENKILELELISNFNNKLTKSKIFIENNLIGYLYFSLV